MFNKPKFMSPSINMYGNSVIDLNSATLPFSCIVDGNEAITDFQIVVSRLKDNKIVFDTGMQSLNKPFFPINNRNQNVVFSRNLKDYFDTAKTCYKPATNTYDETKTYYKIVDGKYVISEPSSETWSKDYKNYYYIDFLNSTDAYYWDITLKNSNTGAETHSASEVFYANDTPRVEIQYNLDRDGEDYKKFCNNLVYNGDTLKYSIGWTAEGCSFENEKGGYLRLISKVDSQDNAQHDCVCYRSLENGGVTGLYENKIIYCSAQVRGFKTNSVNSIPSCFVSNHLLDVPFYFEKIHSTENINDGGWHTISLYCQTIQEGATQDYRFYEVATEIKNAKVGDIADFKDVCVFNLTEIYGSGNEPSKEWCDENLDSLRAAEIISTRCKFKAIYSQEQNIPVKKYGWRLTDAVSGSVIMDTITQKQIYGITDDISCVCNGLMNKSKYILELYVETQNGYFDVLQSMAFYVDYHVKTIDVELEIMALNDTAGIMLNWGNLRTTEGVVIGDEVDYVDAFPVASSTSIEIPAATNVVFSGNSNGKDLEIDENSYVVLSFRFDKSQGDILFEMSGSDECYNNIVRKLEYVSEDNMLKYTVIKGDIISIRKEDASEIADELSWYIVTLCPLIDEVAELKVVKSVSLNGLFPSEDLYPVDLYTYDNSGNIVEGEYNKATSTYDSNLTYFNLVGGELVEYTYNAKTWNSDYVNLYCCLYPYFGEWDKLRS